jgi:hypothetical protein
VILEGVSVPPLPEVPAPYGPAGQVPDWLWPALDAVLTDLQRPTRVDLAVGWTGNGDDDTGTLWMQEVGWEPAVVGVHVTRGDAAEVIVDLADQLQEQFFSETGSAWGEARPPCPGHGHPAEPRVENAVAWWVCPSSGRALQRIGADET